MIVLGTEKRAGETVPRILWRTHVWIALIFTSLAAGIGVVSARIYFQSLLPEKELVRDDVFFAGWNFVPYTNLGTIGHQTEVSSLQFWVQYMRASSASGKVPIYLLQYETSKNGCTHLRADYAALIGPQGEAWRTSAPSHFRPALYPYQEYARCAVTTAGFAYYLEPDMAQFTKGERAHISEVAITSVIAYLLAHGLYLYALWRHLQGLGRFTHQQPSAPALSERTPLRAATKEPALRIDAEADASAPQAAVNAR
jgi:hypothetical protein